MDEGNISLVQVSRQNQDGVLTYQNAAGKVEKLEFLPRDISINGKISSIDGFILDTIQNSQVFGNQKTFNDDTSLKSSILKQFVEFMVFSLFILLAVFIPGLVLVKK